MPQVPAFCDNCGAIFPSGLAISGGGAVTLVGNKAGPCPVCGNFGSIPDGVFTAVGNVIRLLSGPQRTIEQLKRLAEVLVEARRTVSEPNKAVEQIKREAPELSSIVDALPKTRNELYSFLSMILTAVGIVIAGAALYKDKSPSEAEVQGMVDQTIERSYQERGESNRPQQRQVVPQPGRNSICPCGSGKKFKRCCGTAI